MPYTAVYGGIMNGKLLKSHVTFNSIWMVLAYTALVCFIAAGCLSYHNIFYEPGIYQGSSRGFRGIVRVQVIVSDAGIEDIEILENNEDAYALEAMEELRDLILETGSTDLDVISGATVSCNAFLDALEEALGKSEILQ